ncbi:hypothetical protein [Allonocardiopsis opalescens]|uniref:ABC-type phosphate transport system substrate-binding protein n=1 Tax=Allonocardiopsis opalescens TaxID=1144618 RepID=A0A2T0PS57_9ACTN|nr:hypothetical protein [Allonocardiopsis opalescens]PRX91741.1 ABC-type phosphate transport system substrate-binding protein [Allonocardiopsis opalescens]
MKMKVVPLTGLAAVIAAVGLATGLAVPAAADPPGAAYGLLAGGGSDTTQDVSNALFELIGAGDTVSSWNAVDPDTGEAGGLITTKNPATHPQCGDIARPNGSHEGLTALIGAIHPDGVRDGCFDFARSSVGATFSANGDLAYIPHAVDGVTYARHERGLLPRNLTLNQLRNIYQCVTTSIGGAQVRPVLPHHGSGTRSFWLSLMNISEAQLSQGLYPCIENRGDQPNDGSGLRNTSEIMPFSIPQYIAQRNNMPGVLDRRGPAELGWINGQAPIVSGVLNADFPITRPVYHVVASAAVDDPRHPHHTLVHDVFVSDGDTAEICTPAAEEILADHGFLPYEGGLVGCGSDALRAHPDIVP